MLTKLAIQQCETKYTLEDTYDRSNNMNNFIEQILTQSTSKSHPNHASPNDSNVKLINIICHMGFLHMLLKDLRTESAENSKRYWLKY